jgi:hypothetical protein
MIVNRCNPAAGSISLRAVSGLGWPVLRIRIYPSATFDRFAGEVLPAAPHFEHTAPHQLRRDSLTAENAA